MDPDFFTYLPAEVLRAQHGKKVKITFEDGRVIGEGELRYEEDTSALNVDIRLDNLELGSWLMDESVIFKKES